MERIKDFLYDLSDIVISLIIIGIIFGVVFWKLNDAMPIDVAALQRTETTEPVTLTTEAQSVTLDDQDSGTPREQVEDQQTTTETAEVETTILTVERSITIPSGSSGNRIAEILLTEGLIEDEKEFLKVVAELGLGSNLQAGRFTLSTEMSYQEIAKALAGL